MIFRRCPIISAGIAAKNVANAAAAKEAAVCH